MAASSGVGSLATGRLPAQIIAADLNGDGWDDLVVRNAGDGTLSVFFSNRVRQLRRTRLRRPLPAAGDPARRPGRLRRRRRSIPPGSGRLDLVVTNKLTGQVSILRNLGDGAFAAARALSRRDRVVRDRRSGGTPEVTSLEATAGVAAGPLTPGGPTDLVTINPGSNTLDVLAGLGGGRFANPVALQTQSPAQVVRVADFNHDGIADLAVLTADGVSIYLGDGKGGFLPPVTYDAGPDPTGLTIADVNRDGQPDLLVGDAYGDVLVLLGQGDGTFQPYRKADQAIALAVADLTGNGSKDVIYADQGLDRVVVDYGGGQSSRPGRSLHGPARPRRRQAGRPQRRRHPRPDRRQQRQQQRPGLSRAWATASSGRPSTAATASSPAPTRSAIAVADLNGQPDLLVANAGSNDVSVLLGQGSGASWTLVPGPRIKTQGGPDALAVGQLTASGTDRPVRRQQPGQQRAAVPGRRQRLLQRPDTRRPTRSARRPRRCSWATSAGSGLGLATLNAGSNDGTLITGLGSASPLTQTFATGGDRPTTGFAGDFNGNGFTDLVVGNNGDGHLALLLGGAGGLTPVSDPVQRRGAEPDRPELRRGLRRPAELLRQHGRPRGGPEPGLRPQRRPRRSARAVRRDRGGLLGPGNRRWTAVLSQATSGSVQQVSQLLSFTGTHAGPGRHAC